MSKAIENQNISVEHAEGDIDQLIDKTAIGLAETYTTQVIGEDTDIFQLLVSQTRLDHKNIYMITEKHNAKHPCLDVKAIRSKLGDDCAEYLPVIHAISGCATTSKLFGIGKKYYNDQAQAYN